LVELEAYPRDTHFMTRTKNLSLWLLPLLLILSIIAFAALAPVKFLNTITPSSTYKKTADIAYGDLPRQTLDIYIAEKQKTGAADMKVPILIFVHGGGWHSGNKEMYKFLADGFSRSGYDIVIPNYRLFPDGVYPNMLLDTAQATAHIADKFPDRPLVLIGHSAGAYNVLMMGLAPEYLQRHDIDLCQRVAGVISLAGPTGEIKLKSPRYVEVIPDRFNGQSAAINNLESPNPPILLVNGGLDDQVDPVNAVGLAKRMEDRGKAVDLKLYDDQTHNDLVKNLSRYFESDSTLKSDLVSFIDNLPNDANYCL